MPAAISPIHREMAPQWLAAGSAVAALAALGACARSPAGRPPATVPEPPIATSRLAPPSGGKALAETALAWVGAPYRNGGSDPSGFDCSGFVQYVFAEQGMRLPRGVAEQLRTGRPVSATAVTAGDLVFFATVSAGVSHVGIAVGPDAFVHAPSSSGRVRVERLSAPYWARRFVAARRVVEGGIVTPR